jgi:hypothetical protein
VQPRLRGKAGELWMAGARVPERSRGGHGAAKLVLRPALLQNGEGSARGKRKGEELAVWWITWCTTQRSRALGAEASGAGCATSGSKRFYNSNEFLSVQKFNNFEH